MIDVTGDSATRNEWASGGCHSRYGRRRAVTHTKLTESAQLIVTPLSVARTRGTPLVQRRRGSRDLDPNNQMSQSSSGAAAGSKSNRVVVRCFSW